MRQLEMVGVLIKERIMRMPVMRMRLHFTY